MHPGLRIGLFVVLLSLALFFGVRFGRCYSEFTEKSAQRYSGSDLTQVRIPDLAKSGDPPASAAAARSAEAAGPAGALARTNSSKAAQAPQAGGSHSPGGTNQPAAAESGDSSKSDRAG